MHACQVERRVHMSAGRSDLCGHTSGLPPDTPLRGSFPSDLDQVGVWMKRTCVGGPTSPQTYEANLAGDCQLVYR